MVFPFLNGCNGESYVYNARHFCFLLRGLYDYAHSGYRRMVISGRCSFRLNVCFFSSSLNMYSIARFFYASWVDLSLQNPAPPTSLYGVSLIMDSGNESNSGM